MDFKIFVCVLCAIFARTVEGQLRCYACSFTSTDTDQSCLTITETTPSVDCRFTYCTVTRQEFLDPAGHITSFLRGCEQSPDYLNHEVEDTHFRTYYRACTSDLCNIGDGIQSVVGGSLSPRPEFTGNNLLVRGTGRGGASQLQINLFLIVFVALLLFKNIIE